MRVSLATALAKAVESERELTTTGELVPTKYMEWCDKFPAHIVILAAQIAWSEQVEAVLAGFKKTQQGLQKVL